MTIARETLLDLARQRLDHIAGSPNWTREARMKARSMRDAIAAELDVLNALPAGARPAWDEFEEALRAAA